MTRFGRVLILGLLLTLVAAPAGRAATAVQVTSNGDLDEGPARSR
jgi:hypothetical protein